MTSMTTMTNSDDSKAHAADSWTVATAKAHLSQVIDRARAEGPQMITRNGRLAAVIVAPEEWDRKTRRVGSLAEFFASSPLRDTPELVVERRAEGPRDVDL
jgi:prevent-host-death family protein